MKIYRSIMIASLSVPVLMLLVFFAAGLAFLVADLVDSGKYNNGWLGIVSAGAMYSYFAVLISTIPTILLGLPVSLIANKYGVLNCKVVSIGAAIMGGLFLGTSTLLFFNITDPEMLLWAFLVGVCGGSLNGYVFLWNLESTKLFRL